MSRMPGALWVPLPRFSTSKMSAHNIVCIHTMVGSLMGTDGYFRRLTNGVNSHYGTGGASEPIRQWGDSLYRSGANGNGNGDCITIENADMGPGFSGWDTNNGAAVPAFTAPQIEDIAAILAWECSPAAHATCPSTWACYKSGIPLELIPDSKPGRRGIGYHRLGVPGYMVAGGVQWSSSRGKVCPADRRIKQIPEIIARAKGGKLAPTLTQSEEDEPMLVSVLPNKRELIALPAVPAGKKLYARFASDEPGGGVNIRIAGGWGKGKWGPLKDFDKVDGYTGWLDNGLATEREVGGFQVLSVENKGKTFPVGVTLQIR